MVLSTPPAQFGPHGTLQMWGGQALPLCRAMHDSPWMTGTWRLGFRNGQGTSFLPASIEERMLQITSDKHGVGHAVS